MLIEPEVNVEMAKICVISLPSFCLADDKVRRSCASMARGINTPFYYFARKATLSTVIERNNPVTHRSSFLYVVRTISIYENLDRKIPIYLDFLKFPR